MNHKFKLESFDLAPGRKLAGKFEVLSILGTGWEGEVYKVRELATGIERAAKLFFPHRNVRNFTSTKYARKLHDLRHCSMLIQYHTKETLIIRKCKVMALVSEYVEGIPLKQFLKDFTGNRLDSYKALHLLYALTKGVEEIHLWNEYHGDLHTENILVNKYGLDFDLKMVDMFPWSGSKRENRQEDIIGVIHIFHECLGGRKYYSKQPDYVKDICCGLKRSLILKKFPTMSHLREYLETINWI